jgi:hypothetical protein
VTLGRHRPSVEQLTDWSWCQQKVTAMAGEPSRQLELSVWTGTAHVVHTWAVSRALTSHPALLNLQTRTRACWVYAAVSACQCKGEQEAESHSTHCALAAGGGGRRATFILKVTERQGPRELLRMRRMFIFVGRGDSLL